MTKQQSSEKKISEKTQQAQAAWKRLYTPAFGLLAGTVGILAGGPPVPMIGLGLLFAGLYLLAQSRGWLLVGGETGGRNGAAITGAFAALVTAYVFLTGGAESPLHCALYLPVLLAALCYSLRLGFAAAALMVGAAALLAADGRWPAALPSLRAVAVALSFPAIALFGGALRAQMENRVSALSSEKEDLSEMLDMSQQMDSAIDLDMTLNLILLNVQEHSKCEVCAVYLKADDGRTLELRAASAPPGAAPLLPALAIDDARADGWWVAEPVQNGQGGLSLRAFAAEGPGASPLFAIDPDAHSFACLPLANVEGLLGMLYVGFHRPDALSAAGVSRLEHLAARAIFPLHRLLFQQGFRSLAYSDALTGLDNFRQFEETLADELARAERYHRPLSLILLDIDHFKSFNDTRGHQAGDALLGQLAVVLRNALRSVDRPARYGGEEFVILCPETDAAEARLIAERVRRSVAGTAFALPNQNAEAPLAVSSGAAQVTVSLGVATFPSDAGTARDLVKKADIALYSAKGAGRNAVYAYEDVLHVRAA